MARFSLSTYRQEWPRVGALIAFGVGGLATLASPRLSRPQHYSLLNFGALLVHQYEEYQDPGYFPGQFNRGILKSDTPRNYPLNTDVALKINTVVAYPYYLAPVIFPKNKWLGLSPVMFGFAQAVGHGTLFPRLGRLEGSAYTYSPGFLASLFLHVPNGLAFIKALREEGPIRRSDWTKAATFTFAFAATSIAGPNILLKNRQSPYHFTEKQMGPYAIADKETLQAQH